MTTVTESSTALSQKLDAIVSQIAAAAVAEKNARDASGEAYISGDVAKIAVADSTLSGAQSKLSGLVAAKESVEKKIAAAKVRETNARIAEVRKQLVGERDTILELADVVEDVTVALVEQLTELVRAGDALNTTAQSIRADRPFARDHVAHYIESKLAVVPGFSRLRRDLGVDSLYVTLEANLTR